MLRINLLSHRYCCTNGEHGKDKRKKKRRKISELHMGMEEIAKDENKDQVSHN